MQKVNLPGWPWVAMSVSPATSPPILRSTSWTARPMVAFARQPPPNRLPPELISSSSAIGPLTMSSGVVVLVAVWMPCSWQAGSSRASIAVSTTGKYSGRQPAMTALIAIFSIVALRQRGGIGPTTASAGRPAAATMRATFAAVGVTTGSPSVQPRSKASSWSSPAAAVAAAAVGPVASSTAARVSRSTTTSTAWSARSVTTARGAVCMGWGTFTRRSPRMPRPAAWLHAAFAKAVLNTVTVGTPRRSSSTASATLTEVDVPQSPKHCTTASHSASSASSPSPRWSLGAFLRTTGPMTAPNRPASSPVRRDRKRSALSLLLSTKPRRLPPSPASPAAAGIGGQRGAFPVRTSRRAGEQSPRVGLDPGSSSQWIVHRRVDTPAMRRDAVSTRLLLCCGLLALAAPALAETFPSRPVKLIVPTGPGAATDVMARLLGEGVSRGLGQPLVVENMPGASGIVAHQSAARAPADGYTFLFTNTSGMAINLVSFKQLPYDPTRDFTPVAMVCSLGPQMLSANAELPVRTLPELIAHARSNRGRLSIAFDTTAGAAAFAAKLVNKRADIGLIEVPYRSAAQMTQDVASGVNQVMMSSVAAANAVVQAGKVRRIAITSEKRFPGLPDLPRNRGHRYPRRHRPVHPAGAGTLAGAGKGARRRAAVTRAS